MADDFDDFDENIFEDEELYDDEMIDGDYEDYDEDYDDEDEEYDDDPEDDGNGGIDFLGMVQDEEGNWVYPEDLD